MGMISLIVGTSSFVYHASQTRIGRFMDLANIMVMGTFVMFYTIIDLYEEDISDWSANVLAVGAWLGSFLLAYTVRFIFGEYSVYKYVPVTSAVMASMIRLKGMENANWEYFYSTLAFFGTASLFFEANPDWPFCHPESWFQFHSIWHLLSAAGLLSFVLFLYSEHGVEMHY